MWFGRRGASGAYPNIALRRTVIDGSSNIEESCFGGDDVVDDNSSSVNEGNNWRSSSRKRKVEEGEEQGDDKEEDASNLKKPRVVWSVELHQQFVAAVNKLGVEKAVPKKILELMNVPGLTRENVASHLEKYRIYPRRLGGISQHQGSLKNSFMTGQDASFGPLSTLNGFDLQALAVTGRLPAQNLNLMVRFSSSLGQIQQFDSGIKDLDVEIFKFLTVEQIR